jgi:hypothetical protein
MENSNDILTARDYQAALTVQDACNLSGVVFEWARIMRRICNSGREHGTEWKNTHPINVLFASKVADLTRVEYEALNFSKAMDECERLAKGES